MLKLLRNYFLSSVFFICSEIDRKSWIMILPLPSMMLNSSFWVYISLLSLTRHCFIPITNGPILLVLTILTEISTIIKFSAFSMIRMLVFAMMIFIILRWLFILKVVALIGLIISLYKSFFLIHHFLETLNLGFFFHVWPHNF